MPSRTCARSQVSASIASSACGQRLGAGLPQAARVLAPRPEHQRQELGRKLVVLLVGLVGGLGDRPRGHALEQVAQALLLGLHAAAALAPLAQPHARARARAQHGVRQHLVRQRVVQHPVAKGGHSRCSARNPAPPDQRLTIRKRSRLTLATLPAASFDVADSTYEPAPELAPRSRPVKRSLLAPALPLWVNEPFSALARALAAHAEGHGGRLVQAVADRGAHLRRDAAAAAGGGEAVARQAEARQGGRQLVGAGRRRRRRRRRRRAGTRR